MFRFCSVWLDNLKKLFYFVYRRSNISVFHFRLFFFLGLLIVSYVFAASVHTWKRVMRPKVHWSRRNIFQLEWTVRIGNKALYIIFCVCHGCFLFTVLVDIVLIIFILYWDCWRPFSLKKKKVSRDVCVLSWSRGEFLEMIFDVKSSW